MPLILLIDDDATVRRSLRLGLERSGYEIVEAADGDQGIAAFAARPADLVVTDMLMPEVDGVETIRALRKLHRTVPIVAISGGGRRSGLDYLEDIHLFGASAVLEKPFEIAKLKEIIAALLGGADATPPYSGPAVL